MQAQVLSDLTNRLLDLRVVLFIFADSLSGSEKPFNLLGSGFCHSYSD